MVMQASLLSACTQLQRHADNARDVHSGEIPCAAGEGGATGEGRLVGE